jgi:hypothetical protein
MLAQRRAGAILLEMKWRRERQKPATIPRS